MEQKKYLIISGASSGIGLATAEYFHNNQWQIINISRRPCSLVNAANIKADLVNSSTIPDLVPQILKEVKSAAKICIVHNAAVNIHDNIKNIELSNLNKSLAVNVSSPALLNQLLIPHLPKGSSIIFIGSTLSEKAIPNYASYIIAKHAQIGLMRTTCQDLANTYIHTCCICPGFTDTPMLRENCQQDETLLNALKQRMTIPRLIEPEEIAAYIYFCANNPIINGSVLHAHLGQKEI